MYTVQSKIEGRITKMSVIGFSETNSDFDQKLNSLTQTKQTGLEHGIAMLHSFVIISLDNNVIGQLIII